MALSLAQAQYVAELSDVLYSYLPGSTGWRAYTFREAAMEAGVGAFWNLNGSKGPAINGLLTRTLDQRSDRFALLIETIVQHGIAHRLKNGQPITRDEARKVYDLLRALGIWSTKLGSDSFLSSLPSPAADPTRGTPPPAEVERTSGQGSAATELGSELADLLTEFNRLQAEPDRQKAGLALERLLNRLFAAFGLAPERPFRVVGEQIDGSFELSSDVYLLEAKWERDQIPEPPLLVFRGKVEGKSTFSRGLFVAINGYSPAAVQAITRGKQPNFVMMDGAHLYRVLDGNVRLDDLLRRLVRLLAERGTPYVPVFELD